MNPDFFKQLRKYAKDAIKLTDKYLDLDTLDFDHICYQTVSKKDYHKALKQLKEEVEVIGEIPHAGRMLTLARLKKPIVERNVTIDKIEIAEPKPKKSVHARAFDHFSFTVKGDFSKALEELKAKKLYISEVKQIRDHKFVKFFKEENGIEIEFRNKKLEEAVCSMRSQGTAQEEKRFAKKKDEVKNKSKSPSDLEKQLKEEREKRLQALADYQNLQKRVSKERENMTSVTNALILGQLLDILEDFDRAIEDLKVEEKHQVGIRMVRDKLKQIIDANGLEEISYKVGDKVDSNVCEAVGVVAVEAEKEDNTVKEIVQKGYKMKAGGQIVRPVKVIVGKKSNNN